MPLRNLLATITLLAAAAPGLGGRATPEEPWSAAEVLESNGGTYLLRVLPSAQPLPENEVFGLRVWVFDPKAPEVPLTGLSLLADAGMPEHGHGMSRTPEVVRRDDGGFDVSGMLFHMGGRWELYLDVTRGALTERAQRSVELE